MLVIAAEDRGAEFGWKPEPDGWYWRTLTAYSGGWPSIEQAAKDFLKWGPRHDV
jgi:hypothetical protein